MQLISKMKASAIAFPRAQILGSKPSSFEAAATSGDRARDAKNWRAAHDFYKEALAIDPSALWIAVQLGHMLKECGDFAEAEEQYKLFLAAYPHDADIHLQLGHLFNRQCRLEDALPWYEKVVDICGGEWPAEAAQREIDRIKAAPLRKKRDEALHLAKLGHAAEAHQALLPLVAESGGEELFGILGHVCKQLGRFHEAAQWYDRYREYASSADMAVKIDAELQSGHLAKVSGDWPRALDYYIKAFNLVRAPEAAELEKLRAEIREEIDGVLREIAPSLLPSN